MASQATGGAGGVSGSDGAGTVQYWQMQSLASQVSLYNLRNNLDEPVKIVFPDGLTPDGGTTSQYEQSSGLLRQGRMTMPPVLSQRTVDDVWRDIQDSPKRNVREGGQQRRELQGQRTPDLTLEDFLERAGIVTQRYLTNLNDVGNVEQVGSAGLASLACGAQWQEGDQRTSGLQRQRTLGEMTLEDFLQRAGIVAEGDWMTLNAVGNVEQVSSAGVASLTSGAQWLDPYQQRITAIEAHQQGQHSLPGAYMRGQLALQPLNVRPDAILESYFDGDITSPMMSALFDCPMPGRKPGSPGNVADKLMERRKKRTIKNKDSAARSRARKQQAYTNELENKVSRLQEENKMLKKQKNNNNWMNSLDDLLHDVTAEPINLQLAVLQDITKNFSDEQKIGQGGFGIVYKGILPTGTVIAIKKLLNSQTIEDEPFYREATFLMGIRHKNIVRFIGYCANTEHKFIKIEGSGNREKPIYSEIRERLLCFDYMSNGGLDTHLTDELGGLEWHTRYQIIRGICEGLQYLHKKNIVHMDLKPANILLNDYMVPKITDFGISRYLDGVSRYVTKQRLITLGYCAPEYLLGGEVSLKADIFSLGAIVRDIVTGRKHDIDSKNVLRRWRYRWNRSDKYPPLGYQQISKCIEISRSCMAENPKLRPYIWEIIIDQNEEEKMNDHMNNAVEASMVGQISPYPWELLEIDPMELNFPFKPNKHIQSSFELYNERDDYIAFKIQKPSILNYFVEPDKGIMPPHSTSSVTVTLQASKRVPDDKLCKENFVVWCAIVDDGLTRANINEDVFDTKLGKVVDEVMLTVAFT